MQYDKRMKILKGMTKRRKLLLMALLCAVLASLVAWWRPVILYNFDATARDKLSAADAPDVDNRILVVDIDTSSLEKIGQWPWPRSTLAVLAKKMKQADAIGWGMYLTEPDRTSLNVLLEEAWSRGMDVRIKDATPAKMDNDIAFSEALNANSVIASNIEIEEMAWFRPIFVLKVGNPVLMNGQGLKKPVYVYRKLPIGFIDLPADRDGIMRRVAPIMMLGGKACAAFAVRTLMIAENTNRAIIEKGRVAIGKYSFPLDSEGVTRIVFPKNITAFETISALDAIKMPEEFFKGRIVIVGSSAPILNDFIATAQNARTPMAYVHASLINMALKEKGTADFFAGGWVLRVVFSFVFAFLGVLIAFIPNAFMGFCLVTGIAVCSWISIDHLMHAHMWISPSGPIGGILMGYAIASGIRIKNILTERSYLRRTFEKCASPEIVRRITKEGESVLDGHEQRITVLFTDLRDFRKLSENISSEAVISVLSTYFTPMIDIVIRHGGTIDKLVGDALIAFWNAPVETKKHELKAVKAAIKMQEAMPDINKTLSERFGITLDMGIGINAGTASVGLIGSESFSDYTIIGETINFASYLESLCAELKEPILCSESVASACPNRMHFVTSRPIDGSEKTVSLYAPNLSA